MSPSRPPDELPLAQRGLGFLHRARELRGLTPHQLARIGRRLEEGRPSRRPRALVRALAAVALLLVAGTAAAWASGALERLPGLRALLVRTARPTASAPVQPRVEDASPDATAGTSEPRAGTVLPETEPPRAPAENAAASPEQPPRRRPARHVRSLAEAASLAPAARAPSPAEPAGDPESTIILEGRSFAHALDLWRSRRNGPAALQALDAHDRQFARGQMQLEARVLRAEILLASQRARDALAVLDGVPVEQAPRGRELRTLRGELRVRFDRCTAGRADLESIAAGADALAVRARAALARCP